MKRIICAVSGILALAGVGHAQQYSMEWFTIDGGGGSGSGGGYTVIGTIGQADANTMPLTGGSYTLEGGFWPGVIVPSNGEGPALLIQLSGSSVIISWSPATSGFALEVSDSLSSSNWSAGPAGNPTPALPAVGNARFYRLKKP